MAVETVRRFLDNKLEPEIRRHGENPIFAPTPPLESIRAVISLAATDIEGTLTHDRDPRSERRTQIQLIDISRAYFCAATDPKNPTYVDLPAELARLEANADCSCSTCMERERQQMAGAASMLAHY